MGCLYAGCVIPPDMRESSVIMKSQWGRILLSLVVMLVLTSPASGQDTMTGQVVGSVLDQGTRVPLIGSSVTFLNVANVRRREGLTSTNGGYVLFQLEPGYYTIRAE